MKRRRDPLTIVTDTCRHCGLQIRNTRVPDQGWQHTWNLNSVCYPPENYPGRTAEPCSTVPVAPQGAEVSAPSHPAHPPATALFVFLDDDRGGGQWGAYQFATSTWDTSRG